MVQYPEGVDFGAEKAQLVFVCDMIETVIG